MDRLGKTESRQLSTIVLRNNTRMKLQREISKPSYRFPGYLSQFGLYIKLQEALYLRDVPTAESLIEELRAKFFTTYFYKQAKVDLLKYYVDQQHFEEASRQFDALQHRLADPIFQKQLLRHKVRMDIKQRNQVSVLKYYGQLLMMYPEEDQHFELWNEIRYSFRNKLSLADCFRDAEDHLTYLQNLFRRQYYRRVQEEAEFIKLNYPNFKKLNEVKLLEAIVHFHEHRYSKAIPILKDILLDNVPLRMREQVLIYLSASLEKMDQIRAAVNTYTLLLDTRGVSDEYRVRSYYELSKLHFNQGSFQEYDMMLAEFKRHYGKDYYYKRFIWEKEWEDLNLLYTDKEIHRNLIGITSSKTLRKAYEAVFSDLGQRYGHSDQDLKFGVSHFPLTFDSHTILENYYMSNHNVTLSPSAVWLYQSGYADLAIQDIHYEAYEHQDFSFDRLYTESWLKHHSFRYHTQIDDVSNVVFRSIKSSDSIPPKVIEMLYKRPYWDIVQKQARKYDVDPYLILSIMNEVSQFLPTSKDGKDRIGLMRLDPDLSKELAWNIGITWYGGAELFDPAINIRLGTYYMSQLLDRYNQNLSLALVALHRNIETANKFGNIKDLESFEDIRDRIPFEDTEKFVENVLNHYIVYRVMYEKEN